ncbi:MAG: hypothetical protein QOK29_4267 [Rhodospirillaceae bacterium]|jgi:trans-aconitate methyltransferase|nr:hypothetical protein [Rhodospirillaceae bacterium]
MTDLDTFASVYLAPTTDRSIDQKLMAMVADAVVARIDGQRICELGIGDQVWTPRLIDRFPDVTSVDGSQLLLADMQRHVGELPQGRRWTPRHSYFEEFTPDAPFDAVLATYVLEHVDDAGVVLKRSFNWIRPGGRIHIVVPHALSLHRRLSVSMGLANSAAELGETDRRMGHKRVFTFPEMEQLVVEAGYRICHRQGLFCKPLPNSVLEHCNQQQLRGLFNLGCELPMEYAAVAYLIGERPAAFE